jgi:hypothetical protein
VASEYGTAFSEKNLRRMMQFAEVFPDEQIVVLLIRQLSWTHLLVLIPIKDPLKRDFYIEMCKLEKWSSRQLQERPRSPQLFTKKIIPPQKKFSLPSTI